MGDTKETSLANGGEDRSKPTKVVFPPPPLWYRTNAVAARHDMWAYLAGQQIVLVRPKETHTKLLKNSLTGISTRNTEDVVTSTWPSFEMFGSSKDGFSCLSFCQSAWDILPVKCSPLVTGCKEGYVKIWNVETGECVLFHDVHKETKNIIVTCMDWCSRNPKTIYSMDEQGTLVSWYIPKSSLKSFSFGKIVPSSLHCSPHEDDIICIGTKGGNIFIVKTDPAGKASPNILYKVRHDEEIIATQWCPSQEWRLSRTEDLKGHIFASSIQSIKTPTVRLWGRGGEDRGVYQVSEKEKNFGKSYKIFTPLLWAVDPNSGDAMLITATKRGEIVAYLKDSTIAETIHHAHSGISVFGLVQCGDILWSTSYEPLIVGFNLRTMTISCAIPAFKGVCSITPSLSLGTLVGVGGVDGTIRAIDFGKDYPQKSVAHLPVISYRLRSKILSLAWHPNRDNLLAFGTDDGVIGLFEIQESQKHVKQFERHVKGSVYAVDWGPIVFYKNEEPAETEKDKEKKDGSDSNALCLYACGGSTVTLVIPNNMKNPFVNAISIAKKTNADILEKSGVFGYVPVSETSHKQTLISKVADIRWSPDFKIFAIGFSDGRVELYVPPHLQLKCWIKCHSRAIQFLSWRQYDFHPDRSEDHKDRWFATCSNDGTCRLFNLSSIFDQKFLNADPEEESPKLIISSAATLRSPNGERIISSAWSPHDPDLILTVSYDSTGILWDMKEGVPISRYFGHCHRLVTCAFHPANEYLILSASDELLHDFSFHVWDYRDHPFSDSIPETKATGKDKPLQIKSSEQQSNLEGGNENNLDNMNGDLQQQAKKKDLSSHLHIVDESAITSPRFPSVAARNQKKKGKGSKASKSLITSTANAFINSKLDLENEVRYIVENLLEKLPSENGIADDLTTKVSQANTNGDLKDVNETLDSDAEDDEEIAGKPLIYLDLLGDYEQCVKLLKLECESHAKKGDWEKGCLLAVWMGDEDFIERAVDGGHADMTILHLTHDKVSKPLYKKACTQVAEKLILEEEFCKAATFYLLSGAKEKALQVLVENKLFRDAVALMKVSIQKKSPIHRETMQKWLVQLVQDGNFETACKIYSSLKMFGDALGIIEKRDTDYAWRTGMYLAKKCGDTKKIDLLGLKYCIYCMAKCDHEGAKKILGKYDELKWLKPMIIAHESVFHLSNKIRDESSLHTAADATTNSEDLFPLGEFKKNMMNSMEMDTVPKTSIIEKLKDTVVVAVAQNKSDAEIILVRSLVFILFGETTAAAMKEEFVKLCTTWLKELPPFYSAYLMAFKDLE